MRSPIPCLLALFASGCCSGTAVVEDLASTGGSQRSVDTQAVTLVRGSSSLAIARGLGGGNAAGFSFTFLVPDAQISPIVLTCNGAALDGLVPGGYPLAKLCTGGLAIGIACSGDGCQTTTVPAPMIVGSLTVVTNIGHGFADIPRADGETADFAAIVDLATTKGAASAAPIDVNVTLKKMAWKQRLVFRSQTGMCD